MPPFRQLFGEYWAVGYNYHFGQVYAYLLIYMYNHLIIILASTECTVS